MSAQYDVFISCKNLDEETGNPTRDLALAQEIFTALSSQGFRIFFSKISLERLGVAAYKKAIDDALDATSLLVVVGTSSDNLSSRWVHYEWDGFYNDILSGVKPEGKVFVYVDQVDVGDLPRALRQTQCFQHDDSSIDHLTQFIANALAARDQQGAVSPAEGTEEASKHTLVLDHSTRERLRDQRRSGRPTRKGNRSSLIVAMCAALLLAAGATTAVIFHKKNETAKRAALAARKARDLQAKEDEARKAEEAKQAATFALQRQCDEVIAYAEAHRGQYAGIFSLLEMLRSDAKGTEFEQQADALTAKYQEMQRDDIDAVVADLKARSDTLFSQGDLTEAVALVRAYSGPFAAVSRPQRDALALSVEERIRAARDSSDVGMASIADALLRLDFDEAATDITTAGIIAPSGIKATQWKSVRKLCLQVLDMPQLIRASLEKDMGKVVSVQFSKGVRRVRITGVDEDRIMAKETVRSSSGNKAGNVARTFRLADLSPQEQFRRLGKETTPDRYIMRGLLAFAADAEDKAKQYFKKSESELGLILCEQLDTVQAQRNAGVLARKKASLEAGAMRDYASLVKMAGFSAKGKTASELARAIGRTRFDEHEVERVQRALPLFEQEHGNTELAAEHERVLQMLASIRPDMPLTVSRDQLDAALEKLQSDNPGHVSWHKSEIHEDGIVLDFGGQGSLVNISALSGLPIKSLNLSNTPVADLSPLQNMPLRKLDLAGTLAAHRNLSPLRGLPLKWLNLNGGSAHGGGTVGDLSPLEGMPLEWLSMLENSENGNWRVTDLSPLRGMPLKHLDIHNCRRVSDLSPLEGMPLEFLDITLTGVTDVSALKDCKTLTTLRR